MDMESSFEVGSFATGAELESESEYLMQPHGGRSAMRASYARPLSLRNSGRLSAKSVSPFAKTAATPGGGVRATQAGQFPGRRGHPWRRRWWAGRSGFGPGLATGSEF